MEDEFNFNERYQADYDAGILYYLYKHDKAQYAVFRDANGCDRKDAVMRVYCRTHKPDEYDMALLGMIALINDGVIMSPAFIDWEHLPFANYRDDVYEREMEIDAWINSISNPQQRIDIINYLIGSAEIIYGDDKKKAVAHLKAMLPKHKAAAKELLRKAAEERAKVKPQKKKSDYVLSVDEMIQYVLNEDSDAASAIRRMLRYFADEKIDWNSKAIKAMLEPIKSQNMNFYAPVGQVNQNVEHMHSKKE